MLMMKRFFSLMLCVMCMLCIQAQDTPPPTTEENGSGWTDPSGNYQAETVIYAVVEDNSKSEDFGYWWGEIQDREGSQIAAMVDGEVRALVGVENFNLSETPTATYRIYTFRVGGEDVDLNKEITFQIYDASHGVTYPLTCTSQDGASATPTWTGDATAVMPSNFYNLSYSSIYSIVMRPKSEEGDFIIQLRKGDIKNLLDYVDIELMGFNVDEATVPVSQGTWFGAEDLVSIEGNIITALEVGNSHLMYKLGEIISEPGVEVIVEDAYVPMTSIDISDMTLYKGNLIPVRPNVVFNNGESFPSNPYFTYTFDETKLRIAGEDEEGNLMFASGENAKIGDVITVTATADGPFEMDEDVATTTFKVTIASALLSYTPVKEEVDVWLWDGEMDLSNLVPRPTPEMVETSDEFEFDYEMNDPYGCTVVSDNPDVVEYNSDGFLVAKSKGVAHVTFTNAYDPTKTATVTVNVNQAPVSVAITSVNNVEIPEASPSIPTVEVAIGQTAIAIANVTPLNADFDDFTIEFVDANNGPIGNVIEDMSWIEYNSTVENGVCTLTFTANRLPVPNTQEIYLKAIVSSEMVDEEVSSSPVKVVFVNKVSAIEVPESKTVWVNQLPSKEIMVDIVPVVYPEDATNKELEITFDKEGILRDMGDGNLMPYEKGTVKVTYTSVDNPSVTATCEVTIKVRVSSLGVAGDLELYSDGQPTNLEVTYSPENADIDFDYLTLSVNEGRTIPSLPDGWSPVEFINANLYGRAICKTYLLDVSYDQGACEGLDAGINTINLSLEGSVKEKIDVTDGWNWISLMSGYAIPSEVEAFENGAVLTEVRSQTELTYNDPVFGFFGTLEEMTPGQAYKLDVATPGSVIVDNFSPDYSRLYGNEAFSQEISPRWNWVGYPYEYQYLLSETYDATKLAEGDMVITKGGDMAIIKDGEWTGDFGVVPNTGFMLYHNGDGVTLPMAARGAFEQGTWSVSLEEAKSKKETVWHYDGSRFANMMAVVGQLNIDNADDYTIGAFVGDECRGAGKIIDGLVLVSLAGEAGEEVTFRIHNEWTGEFFELKNVLGFTDIAGSLKNPVMLDVPEEVTAIESVSTSGINFSGNVLNLGEYTGVATVTTVDGKVVAKTTESSIAVDNLPAGIYVVSINGGSKPIVKKIVKE